MSVHFESLLSRFVGPGHSKNVRVFAYMQARRHVCAVHTHCNLTGTTWIYPSPNGPHSKSQGLSLKPIRTSERRLLSFRHVPLLYFSHLIAPFLVLRPNDERPRKVLMTWRESSRVSHRIIAKYDARTSPYRIIGVYRHPDRASSITFEILQRTLSTLHRKSLTRIDEIFLTTYRDAAISEKFIFCYFLKNMN